MSDKTPAYRYFVVYKPYGMLSQFSREHEGQSVLADLHYDFPGDVYPVGRLDADSEGLLLLTNDKTLNARLLHPRYQHVRTYWVQVEGIPEEKDLLPMRQGMELRIDGKFFRTRPALVDLLPVPPDLPERYPPVRYRKTVPDTWLSVTLTEGKNRQVRRMCAAAGYPVLRLVRVQIGSVIWGTAPIGSLQPGQVCVLRSPALLLKQVGGH